MTSTLSATSLHDPTTALREADAVKIFQSFADKVLAAAPETHSGRGSTGKDKSLFTKVAMLQRGLLAGLRKRLERPAPAPHGAPEFKTGPAPYAAPVVAPQQFRETPAQPLQHGESLGFEYYEHAPDSWLWQGQQLPTDDWVWDLIMDDVNMFNM